MALKTLDVNQGRTVILERWDRYEMSPMVVQASFLDSAAGRNSGRAQ